VNAESWAIWLTIIAGIVTIAAALWGASKVNRARSQSQQVQSGAIGIQSGRNTTIVHSNEREKSKPRK
jgi:hypothetical protein